MNFITNRGCQTIFKFLSNLLFPLLLVNSLEAQISGVSPSQNALHVPATTSIKVNFNQDMNAKTINNTTFRVWGMQSGPHTGFISYHIALKEATFTPSQPFVVGEVVYFTLTNDISTQSGQPLNKFTGQFTIAVKASSGWFVAKTSYYTGNKPRALIGADFDKDGDIDLAIANEGDGSITMMKNKGNGDFQLATPYILGSTPRDLVAADFDGDGQINVAVVSANNDSIIILKNNNDGTWQNQTKFLATARPQELIASDVDGDGDVDLLMPSVRSYVAILKNNGGGAFNDRIQLALLTYPRYVFAADFDNNGDMDFLASGANGNYVIMRNNKDGFQKLTETYIGFGPTALFSTDLDGDSDNDLLASDPNTVHILKNDGSASFLGNLAPLVGKSPASIFAADLNGDGDIDLSTANFQGHSVSILKNNGNGTFQNKRDCAVGKNPNDIFTADFDGDGDIDLATTDYGSNAVTMLSNRGLALVNPVALNFGQVYLGYPQDGKFSVYNLTQNSIQVTGIASTNAKFTIISSKTFNIGAGDSTTVNVKYAPTVAVNDTGTFTVSFAGFPSDKIFVSGMGIPPAAIISINPATLNFGNVSLTKTADMIVDISNSGILNLNVTQIGTNNPNFSVISGSSFILPPKETKPVAVRFATSAIGNQSDTLKIFCNDVKKNLIKIPLSAIGVTSQLPEISTQPLLLQFEGVEVKKTKTLTLKIYNRGSANLVISKINSNNSRFIITLFTKSTLVPNDSSIVNVQFNPLTLGLQTGNLTITSNDVNEKILSLGMSGIGKTTTTQVPALTGLSPNKGNRLQTLQVGFKGANFISGVTSIVVGTGIKVNSVTVHRPDSLTVNITIAANAATGPRDFLVMNSGANGGTSGPQTFTINNPAPLLTSKLTPANGKRLQTFDVGFKGTNFIAGLSRINTGTGITVNSVTVHRPDSLTANLTIAVNAATGARNFSVSNVAPGGGVSANRLFWVNNPIPTLISLSPSIGTPGQTLNVTLTGTKFISGVTSVKVDDGITINSTTINNTTSLTINITIATETKLGARNFSITNLEPGGGTSGTKIFTVHSLSEFSKADLSSPVSEQIAPSEFHLEQNYPNPFTLAVKSAETTIKYQLPQNSFVTLKIFDMLGREMIALVHAQQAPGYYNATWNGRNTAGQLVPGGIYLCRLQAESFVRVMKMMVVR